MSKTYKLASPEGAAWEQSARVNRGEPGEAKVGDEVELELDDVQELALLAAGWLEKAKKKGDK